MKIQEWLDQNSTRYYAVGIPSARLDAELLVANVLNKDRSWILAHPDHQLSADVTEILANQADRRYSHEPIAYILGQKEFYGREYVVSKDTLVPRPETETMIEELLLYAKSDAITSSSNIQIIDIGTGTGCIVCTAALELSTALPKNKALRFTGLELSDAAIKIAKQNAARLSADVTIEKFDLRTNSLADIILPSFTVVALANLPYVPENYAIDKSAAHEPQLALFSGTDGLDLYRILFAQLSSLPVKAVFTESLPQQHDQLQILAQQNGYSLTSTNDLIQVFTRT